MVVSPRQRALLGALPGLVVAALLLALVSAVLYERHQVREAQVFCSTLIPRLDTYREEHGYFPARIEEVLVPEDRIPERLGQDPDWYAPGPEGFTLTIFGEELVADGVTWYDSRVGRWQTAAG